MATKNTVKLPALEAIDYNAWMADAESRVAEAPKPAQPKGFARAVGDTAVAAGTGVVSGIKMMSDIFGADNAVSQGLGSLNQGMQSLYSPQRQAQMAQREAIIKEAEKQGIGAEVMAYLGSFADAPLDTTINALGTMFPTLLTGGALGAAARGSAIAQKAVQAGVGAGQGVGAVKGSIYEETEKRAIQEGRSPEEAAALAANAQSYAGPNLDQIALGGGLGVLAGSGPVEKMAGLFARKGAQEAAVGASQVPGVMARMTKGAAYEAIPEALQGGQERFASNLAQDREGFDTPLMQGVVGSGVLEGVAAAPLGGMTGISAPKVVPDSGPMSRAANAGAAVAPPVAPPPAPVPLSPDQSKQLLDFANLRFRALEEKANGTKDTTMPGPDGKPVKVPGKLKEFLTPEEQAERDFLSKNGGDVQALANAYGLSADQEADAMARMEQQAKNDASLVRDFRKPESPPVSAPAQPEPTIIGKTFKSKKAAEKARNGYGDPSSIEVTQEGDLFVIRAAPGFGDSQGAEDVVNTDAGSLSGAGPADAAAVPGDSLVDGPVGGEVPRPELAGGDAGAAVGGAGSGDGAGALQPAGNGASAELKTIRAIQEVEKASLEALVDEQKKRAKAGEQVDYKELQGRHYSAIQSAISDNAEALADELMARADKSSKRALERDIESGRPLSLAFIVDAMMPNAGPIMANQDLQAAVLRRLKPTAELTSVVTAPADEAAPKPAALPADLSGAKPNYAFGPKKFSLTFESDIDKALYITAQAGGSKRDGDYRAFLKSKGFTDEQIAQGGAAIKERIKAQAKDAEPGALVIGKAPQAGAAPAPAPAQAPAASEDSPEAVWTRSTAADRLNILMRAGWKEPNGKSATKASAQTWATLSSSQKDRITQALTSQQPAAPAANSNATQVAQAAEAQQEGPQATAVQPAGAKEQLPPAGAPAVQADGVKPLANPSDSQLVNDYLEGKRDTPPTMEEVDAELTAKAEPNLAAAKALLAEQKAAVGNPKAEAAVRKKLRDLASKTPQSHTKTVLALDMAATRLDMGEGRKGGLEFAPEPAASAKPADDLDAMFDDVLAEELAKDEQAAQPPAADKAPSLLDLRNQLIDVRQRIADQGQVADARLMDRERQLAKAVKELEAEQAEPKGGGTLLGKNADGDEVFERPDGMRYYVDRIDGSKNLQKVEMRPTRNGVQRAAIAGPKYEVQAEQAPAKPSPKAGQILFNQYGEDFRIEGERVGRVQLTKNPGKLSEQSVSMDGATFESLVAQDQQFRKESAEAAAQATTRTATQAAASAAANAASALNNAIDGLGALFGGNGRLSSGPTFSEETYAKAKPLFQAAIANLKDAGSDIKETMRIVIRMVLDKFGADAVRNMKPYVLRFTEEVQAERQEGATNEQVHQPDVGAKDQAGGGRTQGGRVPAAQPQVSQGTAADVAGAQPGDVGAPAESGPRGRPGVGAAGADVEPQQGTSGERDADTGRTGASGARVSDAGARGRGRKGSTGKPAPVDPASVSPANPGPGDYVMADPLKVVGGGQVARFEKNKAAIELRNRLVDEGRAATREEQEVLSGYTGWGSFGQELFQGSWAKPAPKAGWEARDSWLRDHLGQSEWEGMRDSIINAHYTDPPTVMAMWDMVRRLGFQGGRTLEPSMGIGNFYSLMPQDMAARSQRAGIELDKVTGSMAKLLFPSANVQIKGYQESATPDNFYDLVIGNWPFSEVSPADRRYNRLSPTLHDYFFLKALDQVKPGGIVIGITTKGTMDKKGVNARMEMARKAELVAAFRLPSGAFEEYAGTKVVTDIIILKKRESPLATPGDAGWIEVKEHPTPAGTPVLVNEYFHRNPSHVIGQIDFGHGTTTMRPGLIVHRPDDMMAQLKRITDLVPNGVFSANAPAKNISYVANHTSDRTGSLIKSGDSFFIVQGDYLAPADEEQPYKVKSAAETQKRERQLSALIDMRRQYGELIDAERAGDADKQRKTLRGSYEAYKSDFGGLSKSWGLAYLEKIDDPFYASLAALEVPVTDGKTVTFRPAAILSGSTMRGAPKLENPSVTDAYVLARGAAVNPSIAQVAEIAGKTEAEVRAALVESGAVFELPNGDIEPSDIYLSGNVRAKLRDAKAAAAEGNEAMARNVKALEAVVPADIPYFKIETQMGATWAPAAIYEQYIAHMLAMPNTDGITVEFKNGSWSVAMDGRLNNRTEANSGFGSGHVKFKRLVRAAIANQTITVKRKDSDGNVYVDDEATKEVNSKISDMRTRFGEWLWKDPARRAALEREYNEVRNAYATPKFDGSFLGFQGMALTLGSGPFNLRKHQVNAIWRALVTRKSLNAHEVGTGKTFTMGGIAVESRRYGLAKKPMLFAHNANSKSVAAEIQMMYPGAKILYVDNLSKENLKVRMMQIANDDWDVVVLPHSLIDRIGFKRETLENMAKEDILSLEIAAEEAAEEDGVSITPGMWDDEKELAKLRSPTAKQLVKQHMRIKAEIDKLAQQASREGSVPFEDLGVDMVMVDEAHEFKKPPIATKMKMKGLQTQTSDRSIAMMFLTRYVRSMNGGANVHLFTGTPITNTMTEVFHMMRYMMLEEMEQQAVGDFDGWFGSFAREVNDVELTPTGEYEAVTRLQAFINVPELRRMIGQYMDVVFAEDMPEMQPRQVGGKRLSDPGLTDAEKAEILNGRTEGAKDRPYKKVVNESADMSPEQLRVFERVRGYANAWRNMTRKERKQAMTAGSPESPIIHEGIAARASFDVRLVDAINNAGKEGSPEMEPHADSKPARVVAKLLEIYRSSKDANQVVFMEQGLSNKVTRSEGPVGMKRKVTYPAFSTVKDMIERLVQSGVPREQIAVVDGSTSKDKRKEVADAMNDGRIRIVFGSSDSLGVGVNMQRNLRAMHHMDAPWMPGELEQRNGRGHRQGNQWNTVMEYRYLTDRLDGRRWQVLAIKQKFITDFMKSRGDARVIEGDAAADDGGDILATLSEAAGDPRILIREKLKAKLAQLQSRERIHGQGVVDAIEGKEAALRYIGENKAKLKRLRDSGVVDAVRNLIASQAGDGFSMTVEGAPMGPRSEAVEKVADWLKLNMRFSDREMRQIGTYGGVPLYASWPSLSNQPVLNLVFGDKRIESNGSSLRSLEAQLRSYADYAEADIEGRIKQLERQVEQSDRVAAEPFHMADQLAKVKNDLANLEADIQTNPVAPPHWLRAGAPVDTDVMWSGQQFIVTGHRWSPDGWFVLGKDSKGDVSIPYTEAMDGQGMPLYEPREFVAPEVITKEAKSAKGDEPVLSRSFGSRAGGVAPRDARAISQLIRKNLPGAPEIVVLEKIEDAPPAVYRKIVDTRSEFTVEGVYYAGKIYAVPANIESVERFEFVIGRHEVRHAGFDAMLGDQRESTLMSIAMANRALMMQAKERQRQGLDGSLAESIEEVLADTPVEDLAKLTRIGALVAAVRRWLRDTAFKLRKAGLRTLADAIEPRKWTDNDVLAFVLKAEDVFRGPGGPGGGTESEARFSFGDDMLADGEDAEFRETARRSGGERAYVEASSTGKTVLTYRQWVQVRTPSFKKWWGYDWQELRGIDGGIEGAANRRRDAGLDDGAARRFPFTHERTGEPRLFLHGTRDSITRFDINHPNKKDHGWLGVGHYFTSDEWIADYYARAKRGDGKPQVMSLFVRPSIYKELTGEQKLKLARYDRPAIREFTNRLSEDGVGSTHLVYEDGTIELAVFDNKDIKSASDNVGAFGQREPTQAEAERFGLSQEQAKKEQALGDIRFSLRRPTSVAEAQTLLRDAVSDFMGDAGAKVSWWDKTIGTQYAKAKKDAEFKRVFDHAQDYIRDVSHLANEAADAARGILPKMDSMADVKKAIFDGQNFTISEADSAAVAGPIFTGTLEDKRRYTDGELRTRWKLNERQIGQYRAFMDAVNLSLDQAVAADVLRLLGDGAPAEFKAMAVKERDAFRQALTSYLAAQVAKTDKALQDARREQRNAMSRFYAWQKKKLEGTKPGMRLAVEQEIEDRKAKVQAEYRPKVKAAEQAADDAVDIERSVREKYERIDSLKNEGYAPLMRFGKYVVHIRDDQGATQFWSLYETKSAANRAARELASDPEFAESSIEQGVLSEKQYELFSSAPLDSMELFAKAIDADKSEVFQEFIKVARNNRSVLKRLLKRKGTAGFSEDVPRVLASFITGTARAASASIHIPAAKEAARTIRRGDVQDEAIKLIEATQAPGDSSAAVRGLMFTNFIGGSIASAVVNLTQPLTMTLPYLSQFGGARRAGRTLMMAGKMVATGKIADKDLADALARAEKEGIVSPQEIHHLQAQASGAMGDNRWVKTIAYLWAAPFGLSEQFNRRVTFLAAYQTAKAQGMADPFGFAEQTVTETQGLYNKANAANLARNPLGAMVLTFKQFSVHYLEWLGRMYRSGPEGKKAVLMAMAMLLLAAGTDGLPFADDFDDLVDTLGQALGYDTNFKRERRTFIAQTLGLGDLGADIVARGFSAIPGVPMDVSIRMGMPNMIPATGTLLRSNTDNAPQILEILGPGGGLAKQYLEAGKKALNGEILGFRGAAVGMLPVALQNVAKGVEMAITGEAKDTLGRKVMDVDAVDAFMKSVGFQPQAVARESEKLGMIRRTEQLAKNVEGKIVGDLARALVDGDIAGQQAARQELADWNANNPESPIRITPQQVRQKALNLRQSREQRFITSIAPERRAATREAIQ